LKEKAFINKVFQCNGSFLKFHKSRSKYSKKISASIKLALENHAKKSNK